MVENIPSCRAITGAPHLEPSLSPATRCPPLTLDRIPALDFFQSGSGIVALTGAVSSISQVVRMAEIEAYI